jgi:NAD+ kinase
MRLLLLGNAHKPGVQQHVEAMLPFLCNHCEIVAIDLLQEKNLSTLEADIALVLGGDGAILRAARQMGYRQTPVLGINLGKLGFLADLSLDQLKTCLAKVVAGEYRITSHLMFECEVKSPHDSITILGLNDIAIRAGPPFHIIDLDLFVDGENVSSFSGDGLIVSTPIGSTAYNLSAGGPILGQDIQAFVITPLCPHTLTNRPLVDSADKAYSIALRQDSPGTMLIIDGQSPIALTINHTVTLRKAPVQFKLVKVPGHGYYQTLRDKLRWGIGPNYRAEH